MLKNDPCYAHIRQILREELVPAMGCTEPIAIAYAAAKARAILGCLPDEAEVRASGFAYECEESTRGIRCIGVPLRKSGKVVAALSVAFPLERYSDAAAASARQALDEARRQIERMLCSVELQF